jgi:Phage integrase family
MGRGNGSGLDADLLTGGEVELLMRRCSRRAPTGVRNRALIAVLWRWGLRIGEALALKAKDFDPESGTLVVQRGKGGKRRVVGVDAGTVALVGRWLELRRRRGIAGGPLFCTLAGGPMDQSYVRHLLPRLARKAGVERRVHAHGVAPRVRRRPRPLRRPAVRGARRARAHERGDHAGVPQPGRRARGRGRDAQPQLVGVGVRSLAGHRRAMPRSRANRRTAAAGASRRSAASRCP